MQLSATVDSWWSPAIQTKRRHHHVENVCNLQNKVSSAQLVTFLEVEITGTQPLSIVWVIQAGSRSSNSTIQ